MNKIIKDQLEPIKGSKSVICRHTVYTVTDNEKQICREDLSEAASLLIITFILSIICYLIYFYYLIFIYFQQQK